MLMPKLLYQGHASFRVTANDGRTVYVDPFAGVGYDVPADIILVTHGHRDHCQIQLCAQKPGCKIMTYEQAIVNGRHESVNIGGITIHPTEAGNSKHDPKNCVGYLFTIDNVKIYAAGDTSQTKQMNRFADLEIDYALLPGDSIYNMDPREAAECAQLIKAKHNILIHMKPGALFDRGIAESWNAPNKLIIEPGEEIELTDR